jgi:hypothetical protein
MENKNQTNSTLPFIICSSKKILFSCFLSLLALESPDLFASQRSIGSVLVLDLFAAMALIVAAAFSGGGGGDFHF